MNILNDDNKIKSLFPDPKKEKTINNYFYKNLDRIKSSHLFDFGKKLTLNHPEARIVKTDLLLFKNSNFAIYLQYQEKNKRDSRELETDPIPDGFHVVHRELKYSEDETFDYTFFVTDHLCPQVCVSYNKANPDLPQDVRKALLFAAKPSLTPEDFLYSLNTLAQKISFIPNSGMTPEELTKQFNVALDDLDKTYIQKYNSK